MNRTHTPRTRHVLRQPIVLVLNKNWQAITDTTPKQAFKMLVKGVATAVDIDDHGHATPYKLSEWLQLPLSEDSRTIRGAKGLIKIPVVIVLARYDKLPPAPERVAFTTEAVWERDNSTCQYCNRHLNRRAREGNMDHVVPRDQRGPTAYTNIVLSCIPCNTRKANRTPEQAGMRLARIPGTPRRLSSALRLRNTHQVKEWTVFGVPA